MEETLQERRLGRGREKGDQATLQSIVVGIMVDINFPVLDPQPGHVQQICNS